MNKYPKTIIGRTSSAVFLADSIAKIPVKVDTGADSSAVWASGVELSDAGVLTYRLFDKSSPFYTGKTHRARLFETRLVRSSNGIAEKRYLVKLSIELGGRRVRGSFTLADRSLNTYPVLIGCRLLRGKFLVDVSLGETRRRIKEEAK